MQKNKTRVASLTFVLNCVECVYKACVYRRFDNWVQRHPVDGTEWLGSQWWLAVGWLRPSQIPKLGNRWEHTHPDTELVTCY